VVALSHFVGDVQEASKELGDISNEKVDSEKNVQCHEKYVKKRD